VPAGGGRGGDWDPRGGARRPRGAVAGGGAGEEEDEEAHWAQEQIRKGMGGLMRGEPVAAAAGRPASAAAAQGGLGLAEAPDFDMAGPVAGGAGWGVAAHGGLGAGGSQAGKINAAAEDVLRTLQQGLQRLQVCVCLQVVPACLLACPAPAL
jgi:hypothetical protein